MASLFTYLKQTTRFIRDAKQELVDPYDLIEYVNQARREIAMRAMCIRVLPNTSDAVLTVPIPAVTGWVAPLTVTISPPDSPNGQAPFPQGAQALASGTIINGQITEISVTFGGSGYFQPQATLTDSAGHTAQVYCTTPPLNLLLQGQEIYLFSAINLAPFPGVGEVYSVRSISIIYSNYRYSLPVYSFSVYQALIRQYVASQYQYVPAFAAQFGQGAAGSLYMYPPPSQTYQCEMDCQCLPSDLLTDQDVEALPDPWPDAVPYWAAHLAFLELQNGNSARMMLDLFDKRMSAISAHVRPGRQSNPYGRF